MAVKKDFDVPKLDGPIFKTPRVQVGAAAGFVCHPASEKHMEALGFPTKLVDNWKEVLIAKLAELMEKYQSLRLFLDMCVKCGSCTDKCQFFLSTGDPINMPAARQDLLRKIYRHYFTLSGKVFGKLSNAEELTEDTLKEWSVYFYQCSECRRCSVFCPLGIDTAEITMAARELLQSVGIGQKYTLEVIGKLHEVGNNLGLPKKALKGTLDFMEEDVEEEIGVPVKFPLDVKGAEVMLIVPSADFFAEPHIYSLAGYAKVFHAAGISYTFSSYASEFGNFGMFTGNYEQMRKTAQRIVDAAKELKPKRIIVGECGHAWRVGYSFWDTLNGPFDFLHSDYRFPMHICEYTNNLIKEGVIRLDKSANDDYVVTYHDSCNVARASRIGEKPGGQFEIPREILKATCNNYVEMDPRTNGEFTFCCGAGAGMLTDEIMEIRVKGASPKVAALKDVMDKKGVTNMAMICAVCKAQFTGVMPYFDIPMDAISGVHQFVSNAILLGGQK